MTTSLAAQLAQIQAKGPNPLDLKAQKKQHSQSLIFEPRVAANQDFDTIFLICYEGFRELSRLDSRFTGFGKTIFSEQSKKQDRTQMTALQNDQLNTVLNDFLGLVGGRLLLKPALKAVEWLVRRFRVQENNTLCMVLTFLPYHTTPMFPTLLSILPGSLPPALRFLHPYVQSLANPPRHAIVYTATHNQSFFAAMNARVIEVGRSGYHYSALLSFWAATTTEAIAGMLDQARSGRREVQKQSQEDVLLRIMPTLNDGMHLEKAADLQVGCYMILTVMVTKAALEDEVLISLMDAVTFGLTQTNPAGLICLAALAQQRDVAVLPKRVLKALLKIERLENDLAVLKSQYKIDKLVLGVILGVLEGIRQAQDGFSMTLVRSLIEADLMVEPYMTVAVATIISMAQTKHSERKQGQDLQSSLIDLLLCLSAKENIQKIIQDTINNSDMDVDVKFRKAINLDEHSINKIQEIDSERLDMSLAKESFQDVANRIPIQTAYEISFLSHSDSHVFDSLANAFVLASSSSADMSLFSDLPVLRKSLIMTEPLYLSFFVRVWCSPYPAAARTMAINTVSECLGNQRLVTDVQILLPYILYGLADSSLNVRRASANLVTTLNSAYDEDGKEKKLPKGSILGQGQIYGQEKPSSELLWLSTEEAAKFIKEILVPNLEECLLDAYHISQRISAVLNSKKHLRKPQSLHKEFKTSSRQIFFNFLCSHAINTPMYSVKFRLLQLLNQIEKVGSLSRTKALLPMLVKSREKSIAEFEELSSRYQISPPQLFDQLVAIVLPMDRDGIQILQAIIQGEKRLDSSLLLLAAHQRIRVLWSSLKSDLQVTLANVLLELAVGDSERNNEQIQRGESITTLKTVPLSVTILQLFLENFSAASGDVQDQPHTSKRRRTSHRHALISSTDDLHSFGIAIKRLALVLELIEACNIEEHSPLLKGLFQVMADLQELKDRSNTDLAYLQVLAMDSIISIVKKPEKSLGLQVEQSAIRLNVLVDCLRTTASPQVQQTALLLISSLASVTPDLVLHSVMPVFTFMGASTLRHNDEYSTYVVGQTMESVIPRLVESLHKRKENPIIGTSELLSSFVAAFEHIPPQRQLDLFRSLANKLGPGDFLFALLIQLLDKYPGDQIVVQFAADLTGTYDAITQLRTVEKYLGANLDIIKPKPTISQHLVSIEGEHNAEAIIDTLLPLLVVILRGERLIQKTNEILRRKGEDASEIRTLYAQSFKWIILLSDIIKYDKKLEILCERVLDSLLGLLSTAELVNALQSLLATSQDEVRLQVLNSFQQRLMHHTTDQQAAQKACLAFLPQLTSMLRESYDFPVKHAALACVDCISEKFGKKDITAVLNAAEVVLDSQNSNGAERSFHIAILLCLATMVEVLGDTFIPLVPKVFPMALGYLSTSIEEEPGDDRLHNAAYSLMCALLLHIPWIITGTYLERLLGVSHESANAEISEDCDQSRLETLRLVARQIEPQHLFAALSETWKNAMIEGPIAVKEHLEIFRILIERQPKSLVVEQYENLTNFLLKAFDLRRIQFSPRTEDSFEDDEVEDAETAIFDSTITMIYKLNDGTFRPMFLKLLEWTINHSSKYEKAKMYRQTTVYTFLVNFFDTLKSIVTSYAGFIIEDAVEILRDVSFQDEDAKLLWKRVIVTLQKAFEHDQDEFWQSPAHFSPISESLLTQLSHASETSMSSEVIPALTELAATVDSANHHRKLNGAILQYMRSDNASIRLAAVQCEYSLTERLGEEWLALLPEMLPFISELQEDDDEAVEHETQRWIGKIEEILGESLNPMLQ